MSPSIQKTGPGRLLVAGGLPSLQCNGGFWLLLLLMWVTIHTQLPPAWISTKADISPHQLPGAVRACLRVGSAVNKLMPIRFYPVLRLWMPTVLFAKIVPYFPLVISNSFFCSGHPSFYCCLLGLIFWYALSCPQCHSMTWMLQFVLNSLCKDYTLYLFSHL